MKVLLLGNPSSGGGRGARLLRVAEAVMRREGAVVEAVATEHVGHGLELATRRLASVDRVVACGGDGIVSEVARALAGSEVPLAIVPAGRGNDMARALDLPLEPTAAARLAVRGRTRRIDLGVVGGRQFCTVAACGLDAEVSRRARVSRLPLPGAGVYVVQLLLALRSLPALRFGLEIDGRAVDERLLLLAVANTPTYGGGFRIAPKAILDDGRLDACAIRWTSRARALAMFPNVFRGTHEQSAEVLTFRCESLRAISDPPLPIEADGEPIAATPATFRCARGALLAVAGSITRHDPG